MALRVRGKSGFYHAYFRTVVSMPDGRLRRVMKTVNLGTTDKVAAKALEAELLAKNRSAVQHQRATAHLIRLDVAAGLRPPEDLPAPVIRRKRQKRLAISDAISAAQKYKNLGSSCQKVFRAFCREIPLRYMDEVTPEIAFDYLSKKCPLETSGKTYNNIKSALNCIFRLTLMESGMEESPFAVIPNRSLSSRHQRPFSEEEFRKIYETAPEPWKTAVLIAWFTGLRQKDVFLLRWDQIDGDLITTTPAKTARFGRSVRIPLHPQLAAALSALPRTGSRILGAWKYNPGNIVFRRAFGQILDQCGISDSDQGIVNFNSLRDSFVTRCDEAGIPRHAIRGLVGHVSDSQTDLYSHDLASARKIQDLPFVKLP